MTEPTEAAPALDTLGALAGALYHAAATDPAPELRRLLDERLQPLGLALAGEPDLSTPVVRGQVAGELFGLCPSAGSVAADSLVDPTRVEVEVRLQGRFAALEAELHRELRERVARAAHALELARNQAAAAHGGASDELLRRETGRLDREAAALRDAAEAALEGARRRLDEARAAFEAADRRLAEGRAAVEADTGRLQAAVATAEEHLEHERSDLEALEREAAALAGREGAGVLVLMGMLQVRRTGALAQLEMAEGVLKAVRQARDAWHPDADPRVTTPQADRAGAEATLSAARAALDMAETVAATLPGWVRDESLRAAEARRQLEAAQAGDDPQGALRAARHAAAPVLARWKAAAALDEPAVEVHDLAVRTHAACGPRPRVEASARLAFPAPDGAGREERAVTFALNFADLAESAATLAGLVPDLAA